MRWGIASQDDDDIDFTNNNLLRRLSFGAGGVNGDLPAGTYYLSVSGWDTTFGETGFNVTSTSNENGDLVVNFDLTTGLTCDFDFDGLCNNDLLLLYAVRWHRRVVRSG